MSFSTNTTRSTRLILRQYPNLIKALGISLLENTLLLAIRVSVSLFAMVMWKKDCDFNLSSSLFMQNNGKQSSFDIPSHHFLRVSLPATHLWLNKRIFISKYIFDHFHIRLSPNTLAK